MDYDNHTLKTLSWAEVRQGSAGRDRQDPGRNFPQGEIQTIEATLARLDLEIKAELGDATAEDQQAARADLDAEEEEDVEEPGPWEAD